MKIILTIILLAIVPFAGYTQEKTAKHTDRKTHKAAREGSVPSWAAAHNYDADAHVYFPDYYTYYDPNRRGYVYWDKDKYVFTPALPAFLEKVDLSKSRVQILKGLSLDLHPEQNYPHYMQLYPPDGSGHTMVPVPIPGNPAR